MALTIAVGLVVGDAVVMIENIVRHIDGERPRFESASGHKATSPDDEYMSALSSKADIGDAQVNVR
jgi:Cu/Ag efflux pump CusA